MIVARERGNGNLCVGNFLVDTWCMGVKDAFGNVNMTKEDFEELLNRAFEMEECEYPVAHNIIYGAVEFAGEADIEPHPDYWLWKGVLDEDSDDVPFIDMEFGKGGKYFLVARPGSREALMVSKLQQRLGDNFDFVLNADDIIPDFGDYEQEEYSYNHPEYPSEPKVRNRFIADELLSPDNFTRLPEKTIKKILALPADEATRDISAVIMYEIGRTHEAITGDKADEPQESSIIHSLLLLSEIGCEEGLEAVLEIMRQDEAFFEYHLGDVGFEFTAPALASLGKENIRAIENYLDETGHHTQFRSIATEALAIIAILHPEKRDEVIGVFRRLLKSLPGRLPERKGCDAESTAFLMCSLMQLKTPELLPEIESVFSTDCVDESICGDFSDVKNDILSGYSRNEYIHKSIYQQYETLKECEE